MSFLNLASRLARIVAREGMKALLEPGQRGSKRSGGAGARARTRPSSGPSAATGRSGSPSSPRPSGTGPARAGTSSPAQHAYVGDWTGPLPASITWQARDDGRPDPGEVVWAWVPYEEDHAQGKDRPSLVIAYHPQRTDLVLALPLTSKDHDRDAAQEARAGRHWMDVGSGPWDRSDRPSEVRLDRVLQLAVDSIRREGSALERATFDAVIIAARGLQERA